MHEDRGDTKHTLTFNLTFTEGVLKRQFFHLDIRAYNKSTLFAPSLLDDFLIIHFLVLRKREHRSSVNF